MRSESARHLRLALEPGINLFDALVEPLAKLGVESASMTILGGNFDRLQYCVAPPDSSGQAVIAYASPIDAGRAFMIFGNATLGKSVENLPLVHCHAAIRTESGKIKGGHMLTQTCIVGPDPISVLVTSLEGFELRQAFDPETNIFLLQPHERAADD
jgi:predicted DNA-binding protein with PD1-like motif